MRCLRCFCCYRKKSKGDKESTESTERTESTESTESTEIKLVDGTTIEEQFGSVWEKLGKKMSSWSLPKRSAKEEFIVKLDKYLAIDDEEDQDDFCLRDDSRYDLQDLQDDLQDDLQNDFQNDFEDDFQNDLQDDTRYDSQDGDSNSSTLSQLLP